MQIQDIKGFTESLAFHFNNQLPGDPYNYAAGRELVNEERVEAKKQVYKYLYTPTETLHINREQS